MKEFETQSLLCVDVRRVRVDGCPERTKKEKFDPRKQLKVVS